MSDGRALTALALLGLVGLASARGSRGVARSGRRSRFVQLEPWSEIERLEFGPTGSGRFEDKMTWKARVPGKERPVRALNLHARPDVIEVFYDTKTKRVVFLSTREWSANAQLEVWTADGEMLMTWNPLAPAEHVPFSRDMDRLVALMDDLDKSGSRSGEWGEGSRERGGQGSRGIARASRGAAGHPSLPEGVDVELLLDVARHARVIVDQGVSPKGVTRFSVQIAIGPGRGDTIVGVGRAGTLKDAKILQKRVETDRLGYTIPVALYHLVDQKVPWLSGLSARTGDYLVDPQVLPVEVEQLLAWEARQKGSRGVAKELRATSYEPQADRPAKDSLGRSSLLDARSSSLRGSRGVARAARVPPIRFTNEDRYLIERARRAVPSGSDLRDALQPIYYWLHNAHPIRREAVERLDEAIREKDEQIREQGYQDNADKAFAPTLDELRVMVERLLGSSGSRGIARTSKRSPCDDFETEQVLVVSTAHIRKSDAKWLERNLHGVAADILSGGPTGRGWMIYVPYTLMALRAQDGLTKDLSKDFLDLFLRASQCDADWLHLDQDGPEISDLPRFEW